MIFLLLVVLVCVLLNTAGIVYIILLKWWDKEEVNVWTEDIKESLLSLTEAARNNTTLTERNTKKAAGLLEQVEQVTPRLEKKVDELPQKTGEAVIEKIKASEPGVK